MKLVIAEKPGVGRSIASVLGASNKKNGYIEGNGYAVTWGFGHLAGFEEDTSKWDMDKLPVELPDNFVISKDGAEQFEILKKLMERSDVQSLVCATDAGREGEDIFRYIYYAAGCKKHFERLWISSMTDSALKEGFENLQDGRNFDNLYEAAVARDKADTIIGLSGTRLFSFLYKQGGLYGTPALRLGRVVTDYGFKAVEDAYKKSHSVEKEEDEAEKKENDKELPIVHEGDTFLVQSRKSEHFTQPPKHYTEASILTAMYTFIDIVPEKLKSPVMTAEMENTLSLVARGQANATAWLEEIRNLMTGIVNEYKQTVIEDEKNPFGIPKKLGGEALGNGPHCNKEVKTEKYGAYCSGKCGMNISSVYGKELTEKQIKKLLNGESVSYTNKGYENTVYSEIEEYSYVKHGKTIKGFQWKSNGKKVS